MALEWKRHKIEPENAVLMVIPASTAEKHEARYRKFCEMLSRYLKIENGYEYLEVAYDREPSAVRRGTPVQDNLRLTVAEDALEGKEIILFDDCFTSGRSFRGMVEYLNACGPKSITGVFLAKTVE